MRQIADESRARRDEARHDKLVEALAEVLAASDPDGVELDYNRTVRLIHRLDLMLDARTGTPEGRLAKALHDLGLKLEAFVAEMHEVGDHTGATQDLVRAHAEVLNASRPVLHPDGEAPQLPSANAERLTFPRA